MIITSSEQEGLIGSDTAPNYHAGRKPVWDLCAELGSLAETSVQGHFSDQASHCVQGHSPVKGRDRETPMRKGVPHFVLTSERHPVLGDYHLHSRVPQQKLSAVRLGEIHCFGSTYTMCREIWVRRGDSLPPHPNKAMVWHIKQF